MSWNNDLGLSKQHFNRLSNSSTLVWGEPCNTKVRVYCLAFPESGCKCVRGWGLDLSWNLKHIPLKSSCEISLSSELLLKICKCGLQITILRISFRYKQNCPNIFENYNILVCDWFSVFFFLVFHKVTLLSFLYKERPFDLWHLLSVTWPVLHDLSTDSS